MRFIKAGGVTRNMPKIDIQLVGEQEAPEVGTIYTITDVDEFKSAVQSFKGYRVTMKDAKGNEVVEALWKQDVAGPNSKIGAYVGLLGDNTDTWVGKKIKYTSWMKGNRNIEVVKA